MPNWLPRIALSETVDEDLLRVSSASAGDPLDPTQLEDLWRRLGRSGLLALPDSVGMACTLKPTVRELMLDHLGESPGALARIRRELLLTGIRLSIPGTAAQLAKWAWQSADWASLERLMLQAPDELERAPLNTRGWATRIPRQARMDHPLLSLAYATASALAESSRIEGTRRALSLATLTTHILREGGQLHSGWRDHADTDALTIAGALWMAGQAAAASSTGDPRQDSAWETHREIEQMLGERSRAGPLPSDTALTIFHTVSAVVATMRVDWTEVHHHAELGMRHSPGCGIHGFVAASMLASSSFFSGSPGHRRRSEEFLHRHTSHACLGSSWMMDVARLPRALAAIHDLDRVVAQQMITSLDDSPTVRWFDASLLSLCAKARAGILWQDPGRALAAFDVAIAARGGLGAIEDAAQPLLLRSRLELLINLGDLDQAETLSELLQAKAGPSQSGVPTARLRLCKGDLDGAGKLADAGLYSPDLTVVDRASLHVIKAATRLLAGDNDAIVDHLVTAACVVCRESGTALPFALIPRQIMIDLLNLHGPHPDGAPCYVRERLDPARVAQLRQGYASARSSVRLTPREQSLLPLLATPATLQAIADELFLSVNTVRKQVVTLRAKLHARNRSELVARAVELGLVPTSPPGSPDASAQ